jgi:hypothetical protein
MFFFLCASLVVVLPLADALAHASRGPLQLVDLAGRMVLRKSSTGVVVHMILRLDIVMDFKRFSTRKRALQQLGHSCSSLISVLLP